MSAPTGRQTSAVGGSRSGVITGGRARILALRELMLQSQAKATRKPAGADAIELTPLDGAAGRFLSRK